MEGVRALRTEEIPLAAKMIAAAYDDDPSVAELIDIPDKSRRLVVLKNYFAQLLRLGTKFGRVIAMDHDGTLGGLAIFYTPGTYPPQGFSYWINSIKTLIALWPKVGMKCLARLLHLSSTLPKYQPMEPHYYLELGCVAKAFQNTGIGTSLSRYLFTLADHDGCGIYAETSNQKNLPIFEKIGYAITGRNQVDGITFWGLWRGPRPAEAGRYPHETE